MTAATGNALRIIPCSEKSHERKLGTNAAISFGGSVAEKPRLGKYPKINGSHAPQTAISRTIIRKRRKRGERFIAAKGVVAPPTGGKPPQQKASLLLKRPRRQSSMPIALIAGFAASDNN